ncbi:hypothetical protein CYMTET_54897 [Cymbomonas tetramitiformis]|uniref:Uncharacterized protein n=1 Tax=Cymbomonas tetramitiformis TaxID=36881 RepID=A0AAE0BE93_9CHLO|nr:hypothetical protein CYMTET_54897 [Cymbomonas tetramitiformis]
MKVSYQMSLEADARAGTLKEQDGFSNLLTQLICCPLCYKCYIHIQIIRGVVAVDAWDKNAMVLTQFDASPSFTETLLDADMHGQHVLTQNMRQRVNAADPLFTSIFGPDDMATAVRSEANALVVFSTVEQVVDPFSTAAGWVDAVTPTATAYTIWTPVTNAATAYTIWSVQ